MIDASKTYRTRDGRPVRIYATDGEGLEVHGAIYDRGWFAQQWDGDGIHTFRPHFDLIEVNLADELTSQIPWSELRPEIQWVAMDDECNWRGFTEKPPQGTSYWRGQSSAFRLDGVIMPSVPSDCWRKTLCKRPDD